MTQNLYRATVIAGNVGRFIGFLFIFYGVWQMFGGNFINGLWIAFIGWFLESAAIAQIQQQRVQGLLTGHHVSEVMSRAYTAIAADTTLQQMIDHHILNYGRRSFIIERDEEAIGLLTVHHIKEIPREQWETTTAAQAMTPVTDLKRIQPDMEMWAAIQEMDRNGVNQLPVMTNGHVKGMLSRGDIISYLRTLQELDT
jgi:predicted transcriptional regulator